MAIEVEDGSGNADAQSYASVEYFKAYAKRRGLTVPGSNPDCEALLAIAWDAMLGLDYVGTRATKAQAGDFPRDNVSIDGFSFERSEIPPQLLNAQCALAIEAQRTDLMPTIAANSAGPLISSTVGPITRTYANSGRASTRPIVEKAKAHLGKLLRSGGNNIRLVRA